MGGAVNGRPARAPQRKEIQEAMATITEPTTSPDEVLKRVEKDGIEFIRFWFTDINGQLKSFAVGKEELEGALEDGMGFDGSSITGFNRIEESDMIAMPDPDTYAVLPWRDDGGQGKGNVARLFCDVLVPGGEPYVGDPRFVMRRALARAADKGFDTFNIGPELEFFYFASDGLEDDGEPKILDKGGYFDLTTLDAASDLRRDTVNALKKLGIPVEYTHHEVGPSQHEIDMRYAEGLRMSDNAMTYRIVVKEIAQLHGVYATFMPKPLFGENGSGMHTHQSLFSEGKNAFFDEADRYHLSDTAKSYIAGLLRHAREIAALFAPNVNSYKRLVPGYEAPVYCAWSQRNRSALVRVPVYHPGKEQATRCELRCPDPSCNPYLTFAAMLHAGLDGIEQGYEIPDPMESNLYDLTPDEREERGIEQLPETLGEAIEELAGSELVREALGDHIFERYVDLKREEWEEYRVQVTKWELERYLPVL
jgi:glutamine synthetase